jgi:pimeloyl-ACP methyl ester carboxylesterase
MSKKSSSKNYTILPLHINGLSGRVLNAKSTSKTAPREILFVYGIHSSIERMAAIAEYLARFGNVTMPDLPGMGGMQSLHKIGKSPTIDNMADYLATFIKLKYKNRKITIGSMSLGFVIVTRMLQKYPDIAKQVEMVIGLAGFCHYRDFKFKKKTFYLFKLGTAIFKQKLLALFLKVFILRKSLITLTYLLQARKIPKMQGADYKELKRRIAFEVVLWQKNDIRTYMELVSFMLKVDLTSQKVAVPLVNLTVNADEYFNNQLVQQHLKEIYSDIKNFQAGMPNHSPSVICETEEVEMFIGKGVSRVLSKPSKS